MKKIFMLVLVVVALVSGCRTTTDDAARTDLSNLTPSQVVETYYNSIATGDYSTAKDCLSQELHQYVNTRGSDFNNIKKLTELKVSPAAPVKLYGKNFEEVQVTAQYVTDFKKMYTSNDGKQFRFVYVAKKEKDSPWRIISIGTGP